MWRENDVHIDFTLVEHIPAHHISPHPTTTSLSHSQFQKHEGNNVKINHVVLFHLTAQLSNRQNLILSEHESSPSFCISSATLIFLLHFQSSMHHWHEW